MTTSRGSQESFARLSDDGIYERVFGRPEEALAGALFLHGLGEHSSRHEELLRRMVRRGLYCRTFDWPGHGRSEGQRGHFESMEATTQLVEDQMTLLREEVGTEKPLGLMGHSMGGFFALHFLAHRPEWAAFAWVGSPLIDPAINASWLKRKIALAIERVYPRFSVGSGVQTSQCRPTEATEEDEDPLMHRQLTVRLGAILVEAAHALQSHAGSVHPDLRLLMTHGSDDAVCPPSLSRAFFDRLPNSGKTYILLEGALHEPFVGSGRESFYRVIERWLEEDLLPHLRHVQATKGAI